MKEGETRMAPVATPRSRRARGRSTAPAVAGAVFALLTLLPRSAWDGERRLGPAEAEVPTCRPGRACPDPGPEGWTARVEALLEDHAPAIAELTRRRIARVVVEESIAAGIDPLLAVAIIDVESGWDARALSAAGARGLMQLQPSTMAREAARHGIAAGDPHDPVVNVRLGIRYLRRLLEVFVREDHALIAYNAGPNRVGAMLQEGGIPAFFRAYPARVHAEQRHLRRAFGIDPTRAPVLADASLAGAAN